MYLIIVKGCQWLKQFAVLNVYLVAQNTLSKDKNLLNIFEFHFLITNENRLRKIFKLILQTFSILQLFSILINFYSCKRYS